MILPPQSRGTQVYFNGNLITETRNFDTRGGTPEIIGKPDFVCIPKALLRGGENVLALRTGSLNNIGGILEPMTFGYYPQLRRTWIIAIIKYCFLSSINIFIFLYFMLIFINRTREKYYLYFSLLSLSLGLWTLGYKGYVMYIYDSQILYLVTTYFCSILTPLFCLKFLISFLESDNSAAKRMLQALYGLILLFLLGELLVTGKINFYQKYIYNMFMGLAITTAVYGMYLCFSAIRNEKPFSRRILLGVSIFSLSFFLSSLSFLDIMPTPPYLIEGFFVMILVFTSVLGSRFAQVHGELERSNVNLTGLLEEKSQAIESLNIYKDIVSVSREHMAFINGKGRFLEVNNAFLKAYRKDRTEVIHNSIDRVFGAREYRNSLMEHFDACMTGRTVMFEKWYRFPRMGRRYMITTLYPYIDLGGRQGGIVFYSKDITELMQLQQEMVTISENERNVIGMELHDNLAQKLFGISLKTNFLANDISGNDGRQRDEAFEIEALINDAIQYTRDIAKSLTHFDLDEGGFIAVLHEIKRVMESRYPLSIVIDAGESVAIRDPMHCTQLYYIIQEAIVNSIKHAGAKTIRIALEHVNGDIQLSITDDGSGIPETPQMTKGIGFRIMRYRARMIGASIKISNGVGGGAEIRCILHE